MSVFEDSLLSGSGLDGWSCLAEVWNLVEGFVDQYLWNRQSFNLKVVEEKGGTYPRFQKQV